MLYEITTLSVPLLKLADIDAAAAAWMADAAAGIVLGRWRTDIGELGQLFLLRRFETWDDLSRERQRDTESRDPFNGGGLVQAITQETYRGFPFLPPVVPRAYGGVYEFRTYRLKPGGLPPTLDGWRAAIGPAKAYTDHLVTNMIAIDGPPRITHIWGFESIQQRVDLRTRHYAAGLWPPKGGPEQIAHATSTIALANAGSPLC